MEWFHFPCMQSHCWHGVTNTWARLFCLHKMWHRFCGCPGAMRCLPSVRAETVSLSSHEPPPSPHSWSSQGPVSRRGAVWEEVQTEGCRSCLWVWRAGKVREAIRVAFAEKDDQSYLLAHTRFSVSTSGPPFTWQKDTNTSHLQKGIWSPSGAKSTNEQIAVCLHFSPALSPWVYSVSALIEAHANKTEMTKLIDTF